MEIISSTSNPKIKNILKLSHKDNLFLLTNLNTIKEAIKYKYQIDQLYINKNYVDKIEKNIIDKANKIYLIDNHISEKLSPKNATCYIFALCNKAKVVSKVNKNATNIVLLDNVQNPENLGVIIRSALAFGVDYVICYNCVNKYHERLIVSSTGLCLSNQVIYTNDFDYIKSLTNDYVFLATYLNDKARSLSDIKKKYINKRKVIIFGNEGHGVSQPLLDISKEKFKLEMKNKVNSLNVSISVSIILYELLSSTSLI